MGSAVGSFHDPNGLQRLVLLCWLLVVCFELGFAETQVKWVPAKGNNEDRGGRPPLPYSQRKLDEMGIKEEDLPDHYFPDDHPTRGTGKSSSTIEWTKTKSKKVFYILSIVVVLYIYHRRRYRHHRYDYIGNAARTDGNRETIASRFGSFAQHVTSDSDEKKLEAARNARLKFFAGCDEFSRNVIPEEEELTLRKRSAAGRFSVNIAERNQQLGGNGPRIMRVDDLSK